MIIIESKWINSHPRTKESMITIYPFLKDIADYIRKDQIVITNDNIESTLNKCASSIKDRNYKSLNNQDFCQIGLSIEIHNKKEDLTFVDTTVITIIDAYVDNCICCSERVMPIIANMPLLNIIFDEINLKHSRFEGIKRKGNTIIVYRIEIKGYDITRLSTDYYNIEISYSIFTQKEKDSNVYYYSSPKNIEKASTIETNLGVTKAADKLYNVVVNKCMTAKEFSKELTNSLELCLREIGY